MRRSPRWSRRCAWRCRVSVSKPRSGSLDFSGGPKRRQGVLAGSADRDLPARCRALGKNQRETAPQEGIVAFAADKGGKIALCRHVLKGHAGAPKRRQFEGVRDHQNALRGVWEALQDPGKLLSQPAW